MKKAQSISINTIVVAAIALIVLVLVVLIFTGSFRGFNTGATSCTNNGGTCMKDASDCPQDSGRILFQYGGGCQDALDDEDAVCCLKV